MKLPIPHRIANAFIAHRRRRAWTPDDSRRVLGALLRVTAAGLVVYHAFLFWDRVTSLTLLDPEVALRWGAAVALLLGFARLWRAGEPLLSGRKAWVVWSLVVLLHAGVAAGAGVPMAAPAEADAGLWLVLGLSGLLALFGARAAASRSLLLHGAPAPSRPQVTPAFRVADLALLFPRPPPVA